MVLVNRVTLVLVGVRVVSELVLVPKLVLVPPLVGSLVVVRYLVLPSQSPLPQPFPWLPLKPLPWGKPLFPWFP